MGEWFDNWSDDHPVSFYLVFIPLSPLIFAAVVLGAGVVCAVLLAPLVAVGWGLTYISREYLGLSDAGVLIVLVGFVALCAWGYVKVRS